MTAISRSLFAGTLTVTGFALAMSAGWSKGAEAVDRVEFFIGADPGLGQATEVLTDGSSPLEIPVELTATLPPGAYRLHFRARDTNGDWGLTSSMPFRIRSVEDVPTEIDSIEYFLNADSGLGAGIALEPTSLTNFTTGIPDTSSLAPGAHRLHFRVRSANGLWGLTSSMPFRVRPPEFVQPMSQLRYSVVHQDGSMALEEQVKPLPADPSIASILALDVSSFRNYLERYTVKARMETLFGMTTEEADLADFLCTPSDMAWVNLYFTEEQIMNGEASFRIDHDSDGGATGMEYGTLTNPLDASEISQPDSYIEDGYFHVRYLRRSGGTGETLSGYVASGMEVTPYSSVGATNFDWQSGPSALSEVGLPIAVEDGLEEVTVRQAAPIAENRTGFIRVEYR